MLTMNSNFVPHGFRPRLAGSITAHYANPASEFSSSRNNFATNELIFPVPSTNRRDSHQESAARVILIKTQRPCKDSARREA
jgi:hypothetical protein